MIPQPNNLAAASRVAPPNARPRGAPPIVATDGEWLMRFRQHHDESAFREVVEAHAPLVWGICWQVLRHREDVEDAFQATFLILARKAAAIRAADSAAGWLYRVAFRTALAARQRRRRLGLEPLVEDPPALEDQLASIERSEQCEMLLEELHALANRYRQPLILCYLEGRSRQEAADELGVTMASVKGRIARGLRLLRTRLAHRGAALSSAAALLASEMSAAEASVGAAPVVQAAALAANFDWHALPSTGGAASPAGGAITLAKKGILAMKLAAAAKPAIGLLAVGMTAGALALAAVDEPRGGGGLADPTVVELTSHAVAADPSVQVTAELVAPTDATIEAPQTVDLELTADAMDEPNSPTLTVTAARLVAQSADSLAAPVAVSANDPQPADVLVAVPPGAEPVAGPDGGPIREPLPGNFGLATPPTLSLTAAPTSDVTLYSLPAPDTRALPSRDSLKLELEYWSLKARGLEKKANVLRQKAQSLETSGAAPRVEVLEMEAESDLTLAEVSLCQARAQQVRDTLTRLEQIAQARDAEPRSANVLVPSAPNAWPQPARIAPGPAYPPPTIAAPQLMPPPAIAAIPAIPANPAAPAAGQPAAELPPAGYLAPADAPRPQNASNPLLDEIAKLREANRALQDRIERLEDEHEGSDAAVR